MTAGNSLDFHDKGGLMTRRIFIKSVLGLSLGATPLTRILGADGSPAVQAASGIMEGEIERFSLPSRKQIYGPVVSIFGIGGEGLRKINRMIDLPLLGVNFIGVDTDIENLSLSRAENRILLDRTITKGLGLRGRPEVGRKAAFGPLEKIERIVGISGLVIIVVGLSGETGTNAAPVLSQICRESGVFTVAIVTRPFDARWRKREVEGVLRGLSELADTLIVLPESNNLPLRQKALPWCRVRMGDDLLAQTVRGILYLNSQPGLIAIDYADFKYCLNSMENVSLFGTWMAKREEKPVQWVRGAIASSLLQGFRYRKVSTLLVNIISDLRRLEFSTVGSAFDSACEYFPEVHDILCGFTYDESVDDQIWVTLVGGGSPFTEKEPFLK